MCERDIPEFDLPQVLFNFDFLGYYCCRIKSVGMTIPCSVRPSTGMNVTLTLPEHCSRVKEDTKNSSDYHQETSGDRF